MANFVDATNVPVATAQAVPVPVPAQNIYVPDVSGQADAAANFLSQYQWPAGLIETMISSIRSYSYRIFILDDSGSMNAADGSVLQQTARQLHGVKIDCSRWAEMVQAVKFHAAFSNACQIPAEFRVLNKGHPVIIGQENSHDRLLTLNSLLDGSPSGLTPLCRHINEVVVRVKAMEHDLRASNQKVSVTIFTDGRASDGDVSKALEPLAYLPVNVILRLCTNDDGVVNYWNHVDDDIELQLDCLDDLFGECEEVTSKNRWLTYGEPLHRLREYGCDYKVFDLMDEKKLTDAEIRAAAAKILGGPEDSYPHPSVNKAQFAKYIEQKLGQTPLVMCPKSKKMKPWIKVHKLSGDGCIIA